MAKRGHCGCHERSPTEAISIRGVPCEIGRSESGTWWGLGIAPSPGGAFALYATDGNPPPAVDRRQALLARLQAMIVEADELIHAIALEPELATLLLGASSVDLGRPIRPRDRERTQLAQSLVARAFEAESGSLASEANRALLTFTDPAVDFDDRCEAEACYRELADQARIAGIPILALQRAHNQAASPWSVGAIADYSVPANSPHLHPCLTREMQGYIDAAHPGFVTPGQVYDRFGCRVDPLTGYRVPEDCASSGETRSLCVGVHRTIESDSAQRFAAFVSVVGPLLPTIGPGLGGLITEGLQSLGSVFADALGKEFQAALAWVTETVQHVFEGEPILNEAAKKTIGVLVTSAKAVADAFPPIGALPPEMLTGAKLLAYSAVREALSFASKLVQGHPASVQTLFNLLDAVIDVDSFGDLKRVWDARKAFTVMQTAAKSVRDRFGEFSPERIDQFVRGMPDLTQADPSTVVGKLGQTSDPGVRAALSVATKYTGSTGAAEANGEISPMVSDLDPQALAEMLPEMMRGEFLQRFAAAKRFEDAIAPTAKRAAQSMNRTRADAEDILRGIYVPSQLANQSDPVLRASQTQAYVRNMIGASEGLADAMIAGAAALARSGPATPWIRMQVPVSSPSSTPGSGGGWLTRSVTNPPPAPISPRQLSPAQQRASIREIPASAMEAWFGFHLPPSGRFSSDVALSGGIVVPAGQSIVPYVRDVRAALGAPELLEAIYGERAPLAPGEARERWIDAASIWRNGILSMSPAALAAVVGQSAPPAFLSTGRVNPARLEFLTRAAARMLQPFPPGIYEGA